MKNYIEKHPNYPSLRVFGSTRFVLGLYVERTKLSLKSALCVFLEYHIGPFSIVSDANSFDDFTAFHKPQLQILTICYS